MAKEVGLRKILNYSNLIATSSNPAVMRVKVTKDMNKKQEKEIIQIPMVYMDMII